MAGRSRAVSLSKTTGVVVLALAVGGSVRGASCSAWVAVSVNVVARTAVKLDSPEGQLLITAADLRRGFVDVPSAARLQVTSNDPNGYLLMFDFPPDLIKSIVVRGLGTDAQISAVGGWIPQPHTGPETRAFDLSYRLILAADVSAGSYRWPVSVSVNPR